MSDALLKVRNLSAAFGGKPAAQGINLDISKGETLAIVGESGSGKSVTALSIMQLLPYPFASHGEGSSIVFEGQELVGANDRQMRKIRGARISMIFQEPMTSLNPLHTVEKQICRPSLTSYPVASASV